MTTEDLDRIAAMTAHRAVCKRPMCDLCREFADNLADAAPGLLALARKGLEQETKICETCKHEDGGFCDNTAVDTEACGWIRKSCELLGNRCGAWEGREGKDA